MTSSILGKKNVSVFLVPGILVGRAVSSRFNGRKKRLRAPVLNGNHKVEAMSWKCHKVFKLPEPSPDGILPSTKSSASNPPQIAPATRDQVSTCLRLWGPLLLRIPKSTCSVRRDWWVACLNSQRDAGTNPLEQQKQQG